MSTNCPSKKGVLKELKSFTNSELFTITSVLSGLGGGGGGGVGNSELELLSVFHNRCYTLHLRFGRFISGQLSFLERSESHQNFMDARTTQY